MVRPFRSMSTCVLCVWLITFANKSTAQKTFTRLQHATDSTYGYTAANPVMLKNGNEKKSIINEMNYLSGLITADKQHLVLLIRSAVANPRYKYNTPLLNDRFGAPLANSKRGILDKYIFLSADTKDTITVFIDSYSKGEVMLPVGLSYELP